jgi:hypothetical protein
MRRAITVIAGLIAIVVSGCSSSGGETTPATQPPSSTTESPLGSAGNGLPPPIKSPAASSSSARPVCTTVKFFAAPIPGKITADHPVPLPHEPGGSADDDEKSAPEHLEPGEDFFAWRTDRCGDVTYLAVTPSKFVAHDDWLLRRLRIGAATATACDPSTSYELVNPKPLC